MNKPESDPMEQKEFFLVGCGILAKEVKHLIEKNKWPLKPRFLSSKMHMNFNRLDACLSNALNKFTPGNTIVFYGACHPLMDRQLKQAGTIRTKGQNCIEMLLGRDLFTRELSGGMFFLVEDWASRWNFVTDKVFGGNPQIRTSIFQECHSGLLGLRTPCSGDFTREAEEISLEIGLPLRWMDVSLNHLEQTLREAIEMKSAI